MGENLALIRESRRREPSMKAISATFPTLLPSPLDRFRFDFMAALPFSAPSLPPLLAWRSWLVLTWLAGW
jgi:hypothetical protein